MALCAPLPMSEVCTMHISAERHADQRQAEDRKPDTPKPDAFRNDPEDPANPNES